MKVKIYQPSADLLLIRWKTEVRDHIFSIGLAYDHHYDLPGAACFLDRNYCYKSLAIQYPHKSVMYLQNIDTHIFKLYMYINY